MQKKIRVLYFVDQMSIGGIQSLVLDLVSRFDKSKIHVDFLLLDDGNKKNLEYKLKEYGCNIYKLKNIWIKKPSDFIKYKEKLNVFFKDHHNYEIIHLHSSSKNYMVLKCAKKYGISVRIAHSHNTDFQTNNFFKKIVGNFFKPLLIKYSTHYFACSKKAGKWLFGEKIVDSDKFKIIHNAVNYEKYKFDENIRKKIRKEFKFSNNDIVVGHVGRFERQKNHVFLIDIFNELYKKNNHYKLLLVGIGTMEEEIKQKVIELGLEKNVIFAGFRDNVNELMQAMDIFILPSLYEGLPVVGIEAQAAGLLCFLSNNTTKDTKILESTFFMNLDEEASEWATEISKKFNKFKRTSSAFEFEKKGFNIKTEAKKLQNYYLTIYKGEKK